MTESYTIECPYCKSVRYNVSQIRTEEMQHMFCRGCDKEFIVTKENGDKITVKKILLDVTGQEKCESR